VGGVGPTPPVELNELISISPTQHSHASGTRGLGGHRPRVTTWAMKVLVLASQPVSAEQLRDALPSDIDPEQGEVMIVAPALQESAFRFWFSDADEAIARAEKVREQTEEQLGDAGVSTRSETGESDPLAAIEDALNTFKADRIVVFGSSGSEDSYKEVDPDEVRQRFGIPVDAAPGTGRSS
jgi:hypothetical protein